MCEIRWKLNEVMARYNIDGRSLAKQTGVSEMTVTAWRRAKTIPAVGGNRLSEIAIALTKLSGEKVTFSDLFKERP